MPAALMAAALGTRAGGLARGAAGDRRAGADCLAVPTARVTALMALVGRRPTLAAEIEGAAVLRVLFT